MLKINLPRQSILRSFATLELLIGILALATFAAFNSALYESYLAWLMPFIPLTAYEVAVKDG